MDAQYRCVQCKFCKPFTAPQVQGKMFQCGHKGGPDRAGRPGFIVPYESPPDWCPRKHGVWDTMVSFFTGKNKKG